MNLDEYFSKYIDAELSAEEDAAMRSLLADDAAARSEFEHAALLSVAMMREADDIETPADLFERTEQSILAKMQQQPVAHSSVVSTRQRALAALVVLLITVLGDSIRMGDGELFINSASASFGSSTAIVHQTESSQNVSYSSGASRHSRTLAPSAAIAVNIPAYTVDGSREASASKVMIEEGAVPGQLQGTFAQDFAAAQKVGSGALLAPLVAPLSFGAAQGPLPSISSTFGSQQLAEALPAESEMPAASYARAPVRTASSAVQFDSYVGSIVTTSASTGSAQHYSESIGYTVSNDVNMGLEVGSMAVITAIPSQFGTSAALNDVGDSKHKGSLNDAADPVSTPGVSTGSKTGDATGQSNLQSRNVLWGAAFVEPVLYNNSIIKVKARMGVGSSDGGPLIFARALSSVNVYGPLSLTIGTEGRAFLYSGKSSSGLDKTMQTMVSMMYGVQLKF